MKRVSSKRLISVKIKVNYVVGWDEDLSKILCRLEE